MSEFLTISQLSSALWKTARTLMGPVDASDLKMYSFQLLYFKKLSESTDAVFTAERRLVEILRRARILV